MVYAVRCMLWFVKFEGQITVSDCAFYPKTFQLGCRYLPMYLTWYIPLAR